jgi:hypothetical protein
MALSRREFFFADREEGNLLAIHPTVKPVALVADAIMDSTSRDDIVLDGFLGSGTIVIAAERTGPDAATGSKSIRFTSTRSCAAGRHSRVMMPATRLLADRSESSRLRRKREAARNRS